MVFEVRRLTFTKAGGQVLWITSSAFGVILSPLLSPAVINLREKDE